MGRWHLSRVGGVIIAVLIACILVFFFASGAARVLAGAVGCVLLLLMAGEGMGSGTSATDATRKQEVLRGHGRRRRWRD